MQLEKDDWEEICGEADIDPEQVRNTYSGRGMFRATCPGFIGGLRDFGRFMASYGAWYESSFHNSGPGNNPAPGELVAAVSQDNMGDETIYYFPGLELV
jgi:hypothetical protein